MRYFFLFCPLTPQFYISDQFNSPTAVSSCKPEQQRSHKNVSFDKYSILFQYYKMLNTVYRLNILNGFYQDAEKISKCCQQYS